MCLIVTALHDHSVHIERISRSWHSVVVVNIENDTCTGLALAVIVRTLSDTLLNLLVIHIVYIMRPCQNENPIESDKGKDPGH